MLLSLALISIALNDSIELSVPDISYFPGQIQVRQFTCRAVTEHGYWLVQDTTWFDLPSPEDEYQLIWGNVVTQESIDSISGQFEGNGISVYETVTDMLGPPGETGNGDDRLWIVFSDIPDYFPTGGGYSRLGNRVYLWPDDMDGNPLTGNGHDIIYVNVGAHKNSSSGTWPWPEIRRLIHTWSVAEGLGQFIRMSVHPEEEKWVTRGLGAYAHFACYGLTSLLNGTIGTHGYLEDFAKAGGIELRSWWSGKYTRDFSANLGGELLWFQYISKRFGEQVITDIAQSELTGMIAVCSAIQPETPVDSLFERVGYPLYEDWMITNLVSPFAAGFLNGIFHYDFLDGTGYDFTIVDRQASFIGEFTEYPFATWIAPPKWGISSQEFSCQYMDFSGDYASSGNTTVHFNGMYNQNNGSGPNIDGRWSVYRITMADDSSLIAVDSLQFDGLFNGTLELLGYRTFLAVTSNNHGGTAYIRNTLSQDTAERSIWISIHQNPVSPALLHFHTSLLRNDSGNPDGFDWTGPNIQVSLLNESGIADSTATVEMEPLSGTLWRGTATVWNQGSYLITGSGYDSLGRQFNDTLQCMVGTAETGATQLTAGDVSMTVPAGVLLPGTRLILAESGAPDPAGTPDIICGPVWTNADQGMLTFNGGSGSTSVYRHTGEVWEELESFRVQGTTRANITSSGTYMLGIGSGSSLPDIKAFPTLTAVTPNPFSGTAAISFTVPEPVLAEISVFDLAGRKVATPFSAPVQGGQETVYWNSDVPPGIYLILLSADGVLDTMKLVKL